MAGAVISFGEPVDKDEHQTIEITPTQPNNLSRFELLPAEVRTHILRVADFYSLYFLVRASPTYHQQYFHNRRTLLQYHLKSSLGDVVFDAQLSIRHLRCNADVYSSLDNDKTLSLTAYQGRRLLPSEPVIDAALSDSDDRELFRMLRFHVMFIEPLMQRFFKWLASQIVSPLGILGPKLHPSQSEQRRVLRALYRFQLCSGMYGKAAPYLSRHLHINVRDEYILEQFFGLFEPWEIEEINTVVEFVREQYEQIADKIGPSIDREDKLLSKFSPGGHYSLFGGVGVGIKNSIPRAKCIAYALARGLPSLQRILKDTGRQAAHLRNVLKFDHTIWRENGVLGRSTQDRVRQKRFSNPDIKERKMRERRLMRFTGDSEGYNQPSTPPLGWTLIWDETYSNLFGDYVPSYFRKAGYVIWDASRFEPIETKATLRLSWLQICGSHDAMIIMNR